MATTGRGGGKGGGGAAPAKPAPAPAPVAPPEPKVVPKEKAAAVVDTAAAHEIADRLTTVNFVDLKFKSTLAELKSRKLSKAMVDAIANRFLGHPTTWKYKSIAEAWTKIEDRHYLDNLSASRLRAINSVNV